MLELSTWAVSIKLGFTELNMKLYIGPGGRTVANEFQELLYEVSNIQSVEPYRNKRSAVLQGDFLSPSHLPTPRVGPTLR
jgi:hypothetical protein